jgi:hypothetical protein
MFKFLKTLILLSFGFTSLLSSCTCDTEAYVRQKPALLVMAPGEIDFGDIPIGFDVTRKMILRNEGTFELGIQSLDVSPASEPFDTEGQTFSLKPKQEVEVVVHFRPTQERPYEALIVVTHDAFNDEVESVTVKGVGVSDTLCTSCDSPPFECLDDETQILYEYVGGCEENQCEYQISQLDCECGCDESLGQCALCDGQDAGALATEPVFDAGFDSDWVWDSGNSSVDAGPNGLNADTTDAGIISDNQVVDAGLVNSPLSCSDQVDGTPCDDENLCTRDDVCEDGVCVGIANTRESFTCDGLNEDCDEHTDEDCTFQVTGNVLGAGKQVNTDASGFQLRAIVGNQHFSGQSSNTHFSIRATSLREYQSGVSHDAQ